MDIVGSIMSYGAAAVSLISFIIVLVRMFQNGQTGLGITCAVLAFCCGIGTLIAFIYGWTRSKEWNLQTIMLVWTIAWVVGIIGGIISPQTIPYKFDQNVPIQRQP